MNQTIATWLSSRSPLILDGGWGTQFQLRGLPLGAHPDLWNLAHPEIVEEVALSYVQAGSDVILTNTFGSSRFILARHGAEANVYEINRRGVEISKKAAQTATDRSVHVFASLGPTGVLLMMGDVSAEELYDAFLTQVSAFQEGGADGIVLETMSDPEEAVLAIRAAKTTQLPVVASMTFDSGKNKDRTMMGTTPEQAVARLSDAGADVIGSNCGQGIEGFLPICQRMRTVTDLPLWMKGNAGLPQVLDGKTTYAETPDTFAEKASRLVDAGASFIGGCCGTSPEFIKKLRQRYPLFQ